VLFHGSVAWSEFWRRTIDALAAARFRVIALDVPPFGFSDRPGGYTRSDQAVRVNDVLRNLQAAVPEYIEVLQKPWVLRGSTTDFADWLHEFLGSERTALSADRRSYQNIKIPVALLWGDEDSITPPDQARDLQTLLPQATLTLLSGLGHIPQIEDPDAFNDALLKSLRKL
jgi:pimeloyl-ACP methyl ester carboxylesterase